jgi:hypothetical protein
MNPTTFTMLRLGSFSGLCPKKTVSLKRGPCNGGKNANILAQNADRTTKFPTFVIGESELGHSNIITTGNL